MYMIYLKINEDIYLILVVPPVQLLFSSQSNEDAEEEQEGKEVKLDSDIVNTQTHKHLYR